MRHNPDPITDEEINAACALIETGWSFHRAARVLKRDCESLALKVRRKHRERMEDRKLREVRA